MAFEGLLAKNIPTLLRAIGPHVPQLLSGLAERFGRDTREIKETLSAEIAALHQSQTATLASVEKQEQAASEMREHLRQLERKLDRLTENQELFARELTTFREQVQAAPGASRNLLLVTMLLALLACGLGVVQFILHR